MKKILIIIFTGLLAGCAGRGNERPRFSQEQIVQLGLDSVKLLNIDRENSVVLDLNEFLSDKMIKTSEFIDSSTLIPLETTDESLIAEINKLICTEDRFFVFDSDIGQNVLIFSKEGKFIHKIPKGGGPEDIVNPEDIAIDEKNQILIVHHKTGLSFFDFNGKFIKKQRVPFYFSNFRIIPEGYLFITGAQHYNVHLNELYGLQVLITDSTFRIIAAGLPYLYPKENYYGNYDYTNSFGNSVHFAFKFSDKVYQLENAYSVKECYQLDFHKKRIPEQYLENTDVFIKESRQNDCYYYLGDYIECATHENFSLYNAFNRKAFKTFIFRDKSTGNLIGGNQVFVDSDTAPLFASPLTGWKDEFIGAIPAIAIHNSLTERKTNNEILKNIDEDANPVLVKYKLKRSTEK
ncbi:MAG: 6-bladed beta-propeller [Prevotellaceae bacterium]|nr:6-bladed beta-propeller [Prevotellaceae bacterium]